MNRDSNKGLVGLGMIVWGLVLIGNSILDVVEKALHE